MAQKNLVDVLDKTLAERPLGKDQPLYIRMDITKSSWNELARKPAVDIDTTESSKIYIRKKGKEIPLQTNNHYSVINNCWAWTTHEDGTRHQVPVEKGRLAIIHEKLLYDEDNRALTQKQANETVKEAVVSKMIDRLEVACEELNQLMEAVVVDSVGKEGRIINEKIVGYDGSALTPPYKFRVATSIVRDRDKVGAKTVTIDRKEFLTWVNLDKRVAASYYKHGIRYHPEKVRKEFYQFPSDETDKIRQQLSIETIVNNQLQYLENSGTLSPERRTLIQNATQNTLEVYENFSKRHLSSSEYKKIAELRVNRRPDRPDPDTKEWYLAVVQEYDQIRKEMIHMEIELKFFAAELHDLAINPEGHNELQRILPTLDAQLYTKLLNKYNTIIVTPTTLTQEQIKTLIADIVGTNRIFSVDITAADAVSEESLTEAAVLNPEEERLLKLNEILTSGFEPMDDPGDASSVEQKLLFALSKLELRPEDFKSVNLEYDVISIIFRKIQEVEPWCTDDTALVFIGLDKLMAIQQNIWDNIDFIRSFLPESVVTTLDTGTNSVTDTPAAVPIKDAVTSPAGVPAGTGSPPGSIFKNTNGGGIITPLTVTSIKDDEGKIYQAAFSEALTKQWQNTVEEIVQTITPNAGEGKQEFVERVKANLRDVGMPESTITDMQNQIENAVNEQFSEDPTAVLENILQDLTTKPPENAAGFLRKLIEELQNRGIDSTALRGQQERLLAIGKELYGSGNLFAHLHSDALTKEADNNPRQVQPPEQPAEQNNEIQTLVPPTVSHVSTSTIEPKETPNVDMAVETEEKDTNPFSIQNITTTLEPFISGENLDIVSQVLSKEITELLGNNPPENPTDLIPAIMAKFTTNPKELFPNWETLDEAARTTLTNNMSVSLTRLLADKQL